MEEALACNFSKNSITPWVFFTFFQLHKWYQIAQSITVLQGTTGRVNLWLVSTDWSRKWRFV